MTIVTTRGACIPAIGIFWVEPAFAAGIVSRMVHRAATGASMPEDATRAAEVELLELPEIP